MSVAREILGRIMLQYPGMKIALSWPLCCGVVPRPVWGRRGSREKTKLSTKYRPLNVVHGKLDQPKQTQRTSRLSWVAGHLKYWDDAELKVCSALSRVLLWLWVLRISHLSIKDQIPVSRIVSKYENRLNVVFVPGLVSARCRGRGDITVQGRVTSVKTI